jgi:uncharacterized protein YbjT (DUF2867 family)
MDSTGSMSAANMLAGSRLGQFYPPSVTRPLPSMIKLNRARGSPMSAVLVTGATGIVGSRVVRELSSRGVGVRALVRNASTSNAEKAAELTAIDGVEVVEGDMTVPATLGAALHGVDRVMLISTSDQRMVEAQNAVVDASKAAGVGHVVKLSGIIPDLNSSFRFARMHGEIEAYLETSGVPFTHLRAGEFMHSYFRQVPSILASGVLALPMADARIASIDVDDIALVAADVLTSPGHEGKIYPLTGPEALTMSEVADRLRIATGNPIRYLAVDPEEAHTARVAAGFPPYLVDGLDELFAERRAGKESIVYPTMNRVFGREPASFGDFALRYADVFRGEQPVPRV